MPSLKHKRCPLADKYTPVGIPSWRTRLFRDRSTAVPAMEATMEAHCMTPPMDATPVHEEEVYETNIAGIGSGMGPSATQMQRVYIPSPSPAPRRGSIQGPNIKFIEKDEVSTVYIEFHDSHRTTSTLIYLTKMVCRKDLG